jgi:hypothetical protein
VKSEPGSASADAQRSIVLKFSSAAHSTRIRAGRSARAQIIAESAVTSPD